MARNDTSTTAVSDDDEWTTVSEEMPDTIIMDTVGDKYVGRYMGTETIAPKDGESFFRYKFADVTTGKLSAINAGVRLRQAMDKVLEGQVCRITLTGFFETVKGQMKDYTVDVKK